ncbi:MAG: AI-2E family transporter [Candidatus Cloacimonetes bacterium]|nr:AI-2E family transporter [Candidatus Cloacimonadota bacterium]
MKNNKFLYFALTLISLVITVYILKTLRAIFIPLTFAVFLQFIFAPISRFLERKRVPGFLNVLIIVILILIIFTGIGSVIYASSSSFVTEYPKYEAKIISYIESIVIKFEVPAEEVSLYLKNKVNWFEIADKLSLSNVVSGTMGNFINFIIKLLLTVAFLVFIMTDRNKIFDRIGKVISQEKATHSKDVMKNIETQVKRYLVNKTIISFVTGLFGMLFVYLFGIDFVVISGFLLFILNYIPSLGSIVASAFPVIICFVQYGLGWKLVGISIALGSLQTVMGNFVEPKLMGTELNLSPLIILISLIFWFWVWGPIGMLLAIPITSALALIIKEIDSLKLISAMISSK